MKMMTVIDVNEDNCKPDSPNCNLRNPPVRKASDDSEKERKAYVGQTHQLQHELFRPRRISATASACVVWLCLYFSVNLAIVAACGQAGAGESDDEVLTSSARTRIHIFASRFSPLPSTGSKPHTLSPVMPKRIRLSIEIAHARGNFHIVSIEITSIFNEYPSGLAAGDFRSPAASHQVSDRRRASRALPSPSPPPSADPIPCR
jgi:hypothetical protein